MKVYPQMITRQSFKVIPLLLYISTILLANWTITEYGFYSAVTHRDNPNILVVRARAEDDLKRLCAKIAESGAQTPEIVRYVGSDYPVRVIVDKTVYANTIRDMILEQTYFNFKDHISTVQGR